MHGKREAIFEDSASNKQESFIAKYQADAQGDLKNS